MSKEKKVKSSIVLKEFLVRDNLKNRNLKMFVFENESIDFERTQSFFRKVEMASKIIDADTGDCYKNKITE